MHGGVKQTAAQAGPQERSNTPSTPVRVRPAASAWRTVAVRFQGSSADSPTICHSLCPSPQLLPPTLTGLEDEVSDDSFASSGGPGGYRPRPRSGPGPGPESPLPRRLWSYRTASSTPTTVNYHSQLIAPVSSSGFSVAWVEFVHMLGVLVG